MRLNRDLKSFSHGRWKKAITTVLFNPCFHAVCLYRLSNLLYRLKLSPLAKIVWYLNRLLYHVDIDFRADLAGGFVLVHGLGTVIGAEVRSVGELRVYQGVTIGGSMNRRRIIEGNDTGQPVFGDDVTVYTDAKIFGPVYIGSGNVIKAGKIITQDIPDHE